MKLERTKNAKRNIIFGIILKIYQILIPFLLRTVLVYYLSVEYLGINSLFSSILSVLNLAELGVGSALVFSMYKPIAEDDSKTICALMQLYKIYYRVIGTIVLLAGLALTPALPYLIKGNLPSDVNLYVLYYLNLMATVLSYWLFAYKNSLLSAHQRSDVNSKITIVANTILYIGQFLALIVTKNYYLYVILTLITQIITNIVTALIVNKMYPGYKAGGKMPKDEVKIINGKVRDLFTAKLGGTIINSADTIVISAFLGLTVLAMYNNYFYIVSSIIGFATIGYSSLTAGIGNSLVTESKEKNYRDFITITFISAWAVCICSCCFLNLFQPFMKMWMGKDLMLDLRAVVCFVLYFVIYELNAVLNVFKDAAGIWHQDRFRPLVVSLSNLALNIATVKFLGIYGVLLSTVVTMAFVGVPWVTSNLFKNIFDKKDMFDFVKMMILYFLQITVACFITFLICSVINVENILGLIIKLLISVAVSMVLFGVVNKKTSEFKDSISLLKKVVGK